jgi:Reverse transcriptase (RNA-dependent DNA polymerase).
VSQQIVTKQKARNNGTPLVFVNLEKAYDMVPRKLLWPLIRKMGIPQKILVVIQKVYAKNESHVKI